MTNDQKMDEARKAADTARQLFQEAARQSMEKSYNPVTSKESREEALQWLAIAKGLDEVAHREYRKACGVEDF